MPNVKLPFGLRGDRLMHISQVVSGLPCQCVCPGCKASLVAKKGPDTAHHFAHHVSSDCRHQPETDLHAYAKRLIAEQTELTLPSLVVVAENYEYNLVMHDIIPGKKVSIRKGYNELRHEDVVPDVQLESADGRLFVEIAVTHFVDQEKRQKLRRIGVPTIEIDLSKLAPNAPLDVIDDVVLTEVSRRKWIYHPVEGAIRAKLNSALDQRVSEYQRSQYSGLSDYSAHNEDTMGMRLLEDAESYPIDGREIVNRLRSAPEVERKAIFSELDDLEKLTYFLALLERQPDQLPAYFNHSSTDGQSFPVPSIVWRTGIFLRFIAANNQKNPFALKNVLDWCQVRFAPTSFGLQEAEYEVGPYPRTNAELEIFDFLSELAEEGYLDTDGYIPKVRQFIPTGSKLPKTARRYR